MSTRPQKLPKWHLFDMPILQLFLLFGIRGFEFINVYINKFLLKHQNYRRLTRNHFAICSFSLHDLHEHNFRICQGWAMKTIFGYCIFLVFFFSKPMFTLFLQLLEKRILEPNEPYIRASQTKIRNICMSVILEFCLPVVAVYSASTAYTSLCRGLKYLLKIPYCIQYYLNMTRFLVFQTVFLGRSVTMPYIWK